MTVEIKKQTIAELTSYKELPHTNPFFIKGSKAKGKPYPPISLLFQYDIVGEPEYSRIKKRPYYTFIINGTIFKPILTTEKDRNRHRYFCNICTFSIDNPWQFIWHVYNHNKRLINEEKRRQCTICPYCKKELKKGYSSLLYHIRMCSSSPNFERNNLKTNKCNT